MRAGAAFVVMGIVAVVLAASPASLAGSLEPPGPPGPTMKTMDQVEPRTPLESVLGNVFYLHVIESPGSYYLSGDMFVPSGMHGIRIDTVGPVTIDLRGFALVGHRDGQGSKGIVVGGVAGVPPTPLVIKNGALKDWVSAIEAFSTGANTFQDLQIYNATIGIMTGSGNVIRHCVAHSCGNGFVLAGVGGTIVDSAANSCGTGIQVDSGGRVEGCTVHNAFDYGISLGNDVLVRGNTLSQGNGITIIGTHNTIDGNSCTGTGYCVTANPAAPATTVGNLIIRNTSIANDNDFFLNPATNTVGPVTGDPATGGPWANITLD